MLWQWLCTDTMPTWLGRFTRLDAIILGALVFVGSFVFTLAICA